MTSKKGHILCVIYNTQLFGSERGTLQATQSLQDIGFQVTVVGSRRDKGGGPVGSATLAQGHGLKLLQFGSHLKKSWILHNKHYRNSTWTQIKLCHREFRQILREVKPSHIMLSSTSALPYLIGALLLTKVPIVYRMGDAATMTSMVHRPLWKWLIRKSDRIITISDFIRTQLITDSGGKIDLNKIHTIHNIAPTRRQPFDEENYHSIKKSKRKFQLVFVGQLTRNKGIDMLLAALIAINNPDLGCWILGDFVGSKRQESRKKTLTNLSAAKTLTQISLLGYVQDPRPYYRAADWHIAPSAYAEPLGNVVQEAQRESTPSITSNRGGLPELIHHKKNGWILEETSAHAIEQAIRHLMADPEWSQTAGKNAHMEFQRYGDSEFQALWAQALNKA